MTGYREVEPYFGLYVRIEAELGVVTAMCRIIAAPGFTKSFVKLSCRGLYDCIIFWYPSVLFDFSAALECINLGPKSTEVAVLVSEGGYASGVP